jgi:hypothetical protein
MKEGTMENKYLNLWRLMSMLRIEYEALRLNSDSPFACG